ncbi:MAG: hypothetical protein ABH859_01185 [Pseudomonadota bacterium]
MERFITHFENNEANISLSVLLELMTILGQYRNSIYLVGGWAPYFLLQQFQKKDDFFEHVGSIDIDLVIDFTKISENQYAGIVELLEKRGYQARKDRLGKPIPFSFERTVQEMALAIDFLAGEYGGTTNKHRHQQVQDELLARKARGADLLPEHHMTLQLDGYLPGGGHNRCELKMGNLVSILSMKGITIAERYKEKDAYDIYALIAHYKEGVTSCFDEISPFCKHGLVKEGMKSICEKFATEKSVGPLWASTFMAPGDPAIAKERQTDIFRQVFPFVKKMNQIV